MAALLSRIDNPFCINYRTYTEKPKPTKTILKGNEIGHFIPLRRRNDSSHSDEKMDVAVKQESDKQEKLGGTDETSGEVASCTVNNETECESTVPNDSAASGLSNIAPQCYLKEDDWPTLSHSKCIKKEKLKKECKRGAKLQKKRDASDKDQEKKKWRKMELNELGFSISLFPRIQKPVSDLEDTSTDFFLKLDSELECMEIKLLPFAETRRLEGLSTGAKLYIRRDRDKRNEKAHKQVKHKLCRNLYNNKGRKPLYMHHRLYKLVTIDPPNSNCWPKAPRQYEGINRADKPNSAYNTRPVINKSGTRRQPVQSLAHTLCDDNVPTDLDSGMVSVLMTLQHRDLTPEDYELLLRLDERVAPKTLSDNALKQFKTETIDSNFAGDSCPVCMEVYLEGQIKKFLPCGHSFHSDCIDMWLKNSSMNCPLDGLPIDS